MTSRINKPSRVCAVIASACLLGLTASANAASYKFFGGTTDNGYTGAYSGAGSVYQTMDTAATNCPTNVAGACATTDKAGTPGLTFAGGLTASTTGAGLYVLEDTAPAYGGLGVYGDGDDQINGTNVLTLTFDRAVMLTGVSTLFASGHRPFGGGFADNVTPTETQLNNASKSAWLNGADYLLSDLNTVGTLGLVNSIFTFKVAQGSGKDIDYYISGLTYSEVPLPAAAWLFMSAIAGFFGISRRRKAGQMAA
jgi:hypothetical protein